jgi:hypothetical protein
MDLTKEWKSYLFGGIGLAIIGIFIFLIDFIYQPGGRGMFNLTIGQIGLVFFTFGIILSIVGGIFKKVNINKLLVDLLF